MKTVNKIFVFLVIAIIFITIIFQLRNTRQSSQTNSIQITEKLDEIQPVKKTPESEDTKQSSSQKNDISPNSGKEKTNNNLTNEPMVKRLYSSEKNIETSIKAEQEPQQNISDNNVDPSPNPEKDHDEITPILVSLGDDTYMLHPGWVKKEARSEKYNQYPIDAQTVCFTVEEPLKSMKWSKYFEQEIDPEVYSDLVFEYTAERLKAFEDEYTLWLFDLRGGYGGFTIIPSSQIIPDGYRHTINVDLSSFDIKEFIHQIAIQVYSGEEGNASLTIHKLEFLPKEAKP